MKMKNNLEKYAVKTLTIMGVIYVVIVVLLRL